MRRLRTAVPLPFGRCAARLQIVFVGWHLLVLALLTVVPVVVIALIALIAMGARRASRAGTEERIAQRTAELLRSQVQRED